MDTGADRAARQDAAFRPRLAEALKSYRPATFRADAISGVTVAIVALPLSMAIAIGSGLSPDRGLIAAIVGGFLVSALGGSRYQIGGPAGAFIVLVAGIVERHGVDGLVVATAMAGAIMLAAGWLRLGTYIRYIPHPVTVGFTAAIAIIIAASQLRDALGLTLPGREPAALWPKIETLWSAIATINPASVAIAAGTIAGVALMRRYVPRIPGLLVVTIVASALAAVLSLPVETVASRFGELPHGLPVPHLPSVTLAQVVDLIPDAFAIALLGGIESLLSAVVADAMSGDRHRPNTELTAQGVANVATALFGGTCVTGTIARTATNIRAGGRTPVAGMLHAAVLLAALMVAAPLAGYIPLSCLSGMLLFVSWNMIERDAFAAILRHWRGEAAVLLATFGLTLAYGVVEGIAAGVVLGSLMFVHRMAGIASPPMPETGPGEMAAGRDVFVYRPAGPLFFGSASTVAATMDRIGYHPQRLVIDLSAVPFLDSSGAVALSVLAEDAMRGGSRVVVAGAQGAAREALEREGLREPGVTYVATPGAAATD